MGYLPGFPYRLAAQVKYLVSEKQLANGFLSLSLVVISSFEAEL